MPPHLSAPASLPQVYFVYMNTVRAAGHPVFVPLGQKAYSTVKLAIVQGEFELTAPIREIDLVRRLGISRTPVREALRRLEAEGVLETIPRGGFRVVEWDSAELNQAYAVRIALERLAARTAATERTRMHLAQLATVLDHLAEATKEHASRLPALNAEFHLAIAEASGNRYLHRALSELFEIFHRYPAAERTLARRVDTLAEHRKLADAIERGEANLAERLMHEHLERGRKSIVPDSRLGSSASSASESRTRRSPRRSTVLPQR